MTCEYSKQIYLSHVIFGWQGWGWVALSVVRFRLSPNLRFWLSQNLSTDLRQGQTCLKNVHSCNQAQICLRISSWRKSDVSYIPQKTLKLHKSRVNLNLKAEKRNGRLLTGRDLQRIILLRRPTPSDSRPISSPLKILYIYPKAIYICTWQRGSAAAASRAIAGAAAKASGLVRRGAPAAGLIWGRTTWSPSPPTVTSGTYSWPSSLDMKSADRDSDD